MTSTIALPMAATSKRALKAVARWLVAEAPGTGVKVFVDTAPVMEKPLAAAAGPGWPGQHTKRVSRDHGSWLFLGAIYTTLDLKPGAPGDDRCGRCRACQGIGRAHVCTPVPHERHVCHRQ